MRGERDKKIKEKFRKVELLILDVDGVLTDGKIVYTSEGKEIKFFSVHDGLGVYLLKLMGLPTVIISAKSSPTIKIRAKDMGIEEEDIYEDAYPKSKFYESIKKKYNVKNEEICFIGDDLVDLGLMNRVGVPVAVKNASPELKKKALYVTKNKGGEGAVREVVELILKSKGIWSKAIEIYYSL